MRHSAATDRFARTRLAKGARIVGGPGMEEHHRLAFPESVRESERLLVKARRAMDVARVQVDVIQHARGAHGSFLLPRSLKPERFTTRPPARPVARSAAPARDKVP